MSFSDKIKQIRKDNNLTQQDLADRLFVTRQAISSWENEKAFPDFQLLLTISNMFDISLDELVKGDQKLQNSIAKKDVIAGIRWIQVSLLALLGFFDIYLGANVPKYSWLVINLRIFKIHLYEVNDTSFSSTLVAFFISTILLIMYLSLDKIVNNLRGKEAEIETKDKETSIIKAILCVLVFAIINLCILQVFIPNLTMGIVIGALAVEIALYQFFELLKERFISNKEN